MPVAVWISAKSINVLLRHIDAEVPQASSLRDRLVQAQRSERLPMDAWWAFLEEMAHIYPTEALGIQIGKRAELHDYGLLGYLAASCETLGEAMQRMQRFQPLLHNLSFTWAEVKAKTLRFGWDGRGNLSTPLSNEILVSGVLTVLQKLVEPHVIRPRGMELLDRVPEHPEAYEALLGGPVHFTNDALAISLSLSDLNLPINSNDAHLKTLLDQQAEALLAASDQPDAFVSMFQRGLLAGLERGTLSMAWLSSHLEVPVRTLYRSLKQRNVSYQGLLDGLRRELATRYLADPSLSLSEIALMLGYSEQSAFSRAFKTWAGESPYRYRQQLLRAP